MTMVMEKMSKKEEKLLLQYEDLFASVADTKQILIANNSFMIKYGIIFIDLSISV